MPTLHIEEFTHVTQDGNGHVLQLAQYPAIATQAVTFTATSAQSATFNPGTRLIKIRADANFRYAIGTNPVATATNVPLASGEIQYMGIRPGGGLRIAAITA